MEFICKSYHTLCSLSQFVINGIKADCDDFVEKYDHDTKNAPDYGCGNMQADIIPFTQKVLDKYHISESEYYEVAEKVSEELSFGRCGWCI